MSSSAPPASGRPGTLELAALVRNQQPEAKAVEKDWTAGRQELTMSAFLPAGRGEQP